MQNQENNKTITFRFATLQALMKVVNIEKKDNDSKFESWFNYKYKIKDDEDFLIKRLIKKHKLFLHSYNEQTLEMRFISPILNKIDFETEHFKDWYEYKISAEINGYTLTGTPDFMVANGLDIPEISSYKNIKED